MEVFSRLKFLLRESSCDTLTKQNTNRNPNRIRLIVRENSPHSKVPCPWPQLDLERTTGRTHIRVHVAQKSKVSILWLLVLFLSNTSRFSWNCSFNRVSTISSPYLRCTSHPQSSTKGQFYLLVTRLVWQNSVISEEDTASFQWLRGQLILLQRRIPWAGRLAVGHICSSSVLPCLPSLLWCISVP